MHPSCPTDMTKRYRHLYPAGRAQGADLPTDANGERSYSISPCRHRHVPVGLLLARVCLAGGASLATWFVYSVSGRLAATCRQP
jgi:hypothetical protein